MTLVARLVRPCPPCQGWSRKLSSSRKPTCSARTTVLDSGLNAEVTSWKTENRIAL